MYTHWMPTYESNTEGTGRVSRRHKIQHNNGREAVHRAP